MVRICWSWLKQDSIACVDAASLIAHSSFILPSSTFALFLLKSLGDAVIVCLHSEPGSPRVLPRGRVSPDSAEHPTAFLAALETPPMNPQSPSARGKQLSAAAEAAVAAARKKGTPGLVPFVPECLAGTLVEAFGVLAAADATDKRDRYECVRAVRASCATVVKFVSFYDMQNRSTG